ncbi:non-ribosomal peptide synthetase [Pseudomonas karstica]|nr:non-ribosomal peptide synthetase [Pseudomonas karstica]
MNQPLDLSPTYPLTAAQHDIWLDQMTQGDSPLYTIGGYIQIKGRIDPERFQQAIGLLIEKHDALRTVLLPNVGEEGAPMQALACALVAQVPLQDFSDCVDPEAAVQVWMQQQIEIAFPLDGRRLFRFHLAKLGDTSFYFVAHVHHLILDGWGISLMFGSVGELYSALENNQQPDLAAPSYVEFIHDDARYRDSLRFARDQAYWLKKYRVVPEPLFVARYRDQHLDRWAPSRLLAQRYPHPLNERIDALAKVHQVSRFHVLLAALYVYFVRTPQRDELVIGLPIHNRSNAKFRNTLGLFTQVSAVRLQFSDELSFGELAREIARTLKQDYRHQRFPLSDMNRSLGLRRDDRAQLFDLSFSYEQVDHPFMYGQSPASGVRSSSNHEQTPLTIHIRTSPHEETGWIHFTYNEAYFQQADIEALVERFMHVLEQGLADDSLPVRGFILPTPAEALMLQTWNATTRSYPQDKTVHALFEAQVLAHPQATAAVHDGQSLTYNQLNIRANRLAQHLVSLGVHPGESVATLLERSLELLVSQLAIIKSAAVYVPLDISAPIDRKGFMVQDSGARIVLTLSATTVPDGVRRVDMDTVALDSLACDPQQPQSSESPACIMYTSGSTGTPKGVLVPHRAISRLVINNGYAAFNARDRVAFASNPAFDASTLDVWAPLLNGGCVVIVEQDVLLSQERFSALLREQKISVLWMTAGLFHQYAAGLMSVFSKLRYLIVGGDVLDPAVIGRVLKEGAPQHLLNGYGPTEATTFTTTFEIKSVGEGSIPIGHPVGNTQVYVLDAHQQPVPIGVAGELYIGGDGVAKGYLNRPELTAEKFVTDPFSVEPNALLYRTGDLGRWLPDGNVEYLGRNDDQVKIRGFRIELGEIEARLGECAGVKNAVVLARQDESGPKRLVGYVIAQPEVSLSVQELRAELAASLAEYMMPSALVVLEVFPLTANGKLDRRALPAPGADAYASREYEAPQGEVEQTLARLWADLLKVEQVGRYDHFFELGGHSLLAVSLIERMRQADLSADVRVLFNQPTLAALAAAVGSGKEIYVPDNLIPLNCEHITPDLLPLATLSQETIDRIVATVSGGARNVQDIYPLAPLQEGILYHHLAAEQGDPYVLQAQYAFDNRERLDAFVQALQGVIGRHDILRTGVVWNGLESPAQVVWRKAKLHLEQVELDPAAGDVVVQLSQRFDPRHHRLDISQAPMMRLAYAQDEANQRLVATLLFHHIALDHTALAVMQHEMQLHLLGQTEQLGEAMPYRNYVAQARFGSNADEHEAFFREMLGEVDEPTLPFGLQDVQGDGHGIDVARQPVDLTLSKRLRAQARQLGVSAACLVHLAFALVLGKVAGKQDVVFGTVLLGRLQAGDGADRALGMFINTLPLRVDVGAQGVRAGVKATHARLTALLGHEHASLALAQRCSSVSAPTPLFSALLNYRHSAGEVIAGALSAWQGITALWGDERSNYPLTLNVDDSGEAFYLTALVAKPIGAERICGYMQVALDNLVQALETAPRTALQDLTVLPVAERQQLLETWNTTDTFYPHDELIHRLFEARAAAQPDAVAVVFEGQALTYAELNTRANQLAHHLIELGIRPDDRVAICVERSLEMIVGLLGILKSGAGYVPLDPAYPPDRITYLLKDSTPVALLAQAATHHLLDAVSVPVIDLDGGNWQVKSVANPWVTGLTSSHLAYVIYTSGSTGLPKGVMVEHRNVARLFSATQPWFDFGPQDIWALFHSFAFDFSVWEIWGALTHGGRLLVVPQLISRSPADCYALLCEAGVTVLNQTPSAFRQLIAAQGDSGLSHNVRQVIFGGEALDTGMLKPWYTREANAHTQLVNMYGITETTVHVTYRALSAADAQLIGVSPIGGRIPDLQLYVLDALREPVPVGVVGEMYVGGGGVARGYLNRAELTAERFLSNPFSSAPSARMYRTGDLGRWLADGSVEYLGRNDDQVKVRGFRIELGEIEARLADCESVREAVVIVREDELGDKRLVAYVIAQENIELVVAELRSQLLLTLADYMVPSAFVVLDALPLTTNGKLDRQALPVPDQSSVITRKYVAPQTEDEQSIAAIWQDVLSLPQVGLHDDFFESGGDSIRVINLISRVQKAFPANRVSIMAFYQAPTVLGLVALLTTPANQAHEWLPELTRGTLNSTLTLVCVPYAGASAMVYQPLADQLCQRLPSARVYAVALPGNQMEASFDDSLSLMDMARACAERIRQRIPGPVSVYGHCAGCILAMEITRQLELQGHAVRFVMLGGALAPPIWVKYIPWNNPWCWHSDVSLNRLIKSWGGASALNEVAMAGLLRGFRRDAGLAMQHIKQHGCMKIGAPIINVLSQDDPLTRGKEARYRFWGRFSRVVHGVLLADGGHYFVSSRAAEVAGVILQANQDRDSLIEIPGIIQP